MANTAGAALGALSVPFVLWPAFGARGATLTTENNFTTTWQPYDKSTGQTPKATEHWFAGAVAVQLLVYDHF